LGNTGLADKVLEINQQLAKLSREAVSNRGLVAGDLASTGRFIKPLEIFRLKIV
jgi:5-methyltetrahydrofolate--homocysteine methyltransferase